MPWRSTEVPTTSANLRAPDELVKKRVRYSARVSRTAAARPRTEESSLNSLLWRTSPAALAVAVLAGTWWIGRAANGGPIGFPLDDAWIHFVYGRGLLENGFLAYENGVPTTGCTSPLWAVLLALAHALTPEAAGTSAIVGLVNALNAALFVGTSLAAADLARQITADRQTGFVAGVITAAAIPMAVAAFSGMEVSLAALLITVGVRDVVRRSWVRAGVWLGLAGLARPEAAAVILVAAAVAAQTAAPGHRVRTLLRLLAGPAVAAAAFVAYDLWASGAPLPATFYAKSSLSAASLPGRIGRALTGIFPAIPPFGFGLGWLALLGLLPGMDRSTGDGRRAAAAARSLPALAGGAYVLLNLVLIDPVDPDAFYHVRYLLPAVPLLLVGLTIGAHGIDSRMPARARKVPGRILLGLTALGAVLTIGPQSRHLHNDVRNINEVQRRIGEHLHDTLAAGTRIAATDAGAVRYFSRLPVIDVIGLNTPEMREPSDEFLRSHPVQALVLMPAWFATPDRERLEPIFRAETSDYTVTSSEAMAVQIVLRLREETAGEDAARLRFGGFHRFELDFVR